VKERVYGSRNYAHSKIKRRRQPVDADIVLS